MKFGKSDKTPKKTPQEEYADQIALLTESELRDLHKDLKIDHYGNSTAAAINTAAGVGLLSMRSTTRRYRTEVWQIEAMEARMKENGWTAHPTRYRDAVPIALGVAAGTTEGMTLGLINVQKNVKRTKDYVKKTDMFKTKELAENKVNDAGDAGIQNVDVVDHSDGVSALTEISDAKALTEESVVVEHTIARKPVPVPATGKPEAAYTIAGQTTTSNMVLEKTTSETEDVNPATVAAVDHEPRKTKKDSLLSQVSIVNKKLRTITRTQSAPVDDSVPNASIQANIEASSGPATLQSEEVKPDDLGIDVEQEKFTSTVTTTETTTVEGAEPTTDSKTTKTKKKEALLSQVTLMNKKMRTFTFKKDKEEKGTTVSITEIPYDAQSPEEPSNTDDGHGLAEKLDSPPIYAAEAKRYVV